MVNRIRTNKFLLRSSSLLLIVILLSSSIASVVSALSNDPSTSLDEQFYKDNDIFYYDPRATCSTSTSTSDTTSVSVNVSGDLPAETLSRLKSGNVLAKVQANMLRYAAAQSATGLPWQILAALHYREGGLNPTSSIADGEPLKNGLSVDGVRMSSDPNQDAILAAQHFIGNVKGVYGVNIKTDQSLDAIANGFLAYNRGSMYKSAGATWQQSPYVANYLDDQHIGMSWIHADSYFGSKKLNNVEGKKDGNVGALAVYKYLGGKMNGNTSASATLSNISESSACSGVESTGGSGGGSASIVGDTAFPLKGTKAVVTNPGMFANGTASRSGHPYIAFDILSTSGTPVVAFMSGTVVSVGNDKCGGRAIEVYNKENNKTITYMHMNTSSMVTKGQQLNLGQQVGVVGSAANGCGTVHLHIDAVQGSSRPFCKRENCPVANQQFFRDIGPQLFNTFQALPNKGSTL